MSRVREHVKRSALGKVVRVRTHDRRPRDGPRTEAASKHSLTDEDRLHDARLAIARQEAQASNKGPWGEALNLTAGRSPDEATRALVQEYHRTSPDTDAGRYKRGVLATSAIYVGVYARPNTYAHRVATETQGRGFVRHQGR